MRRPQPRAGTRDGGKPGERHDATLTELASAQSGSMVADTAPNAPANGSFDLVKGVAGSALGSSGARYALTISAVDLTEVSQPWPTQTLSPGLRCCQRVELSGTGPITSASKHSRSRSPAVAPAAHLAGHTLQCVASLVSQGAQIASIIHSPPSCSSNRGSTDAIRVRILANARRRLAMRPQALW